MPPSAPIQEWDSRPHFKPNVCVFFQREVFNFPQSLKSYQYALIWFRASGMGLSLEGGSRTGLW